MTKLNSCDDWIEKFLDGNFEERPSDFESHLASCTKCLEFYEKYTKMEAAIRALPLDEPPSMLSMVRVLMEKEKELQAQQKKVSAPIEKEKELQAQQKKVSAPIEKEKELQAQQKKVSTPIEKEKELQAQRKEAMYTVNMRIRGPEMFSEVLGGDIEDTELTIESIVGTALLEVFDTVFVENVTVQHSRAPEVNVDSVA